MEVTWVFKDGAVSPPQQMPCFGATGRVDWKGCNKKLYKDICARSESLNIATPKDQESEQRYWTDKRGVKAIRLTGITFKMLFHKRNHGMWDYIVHRSIWAPLFDKTAQEICKQEYVDLLVDTDIPSEIQTSLHIWMRDHMNNSSTGCTFDMLAPHVGEHLAFILSLCFNRLYMGASRGTHGGEGLSQDLDLRFWVQPDVSNLAVIPYNMSQVHGYVMNITQVWKCHNIPDQPVTLLALLHHLERKSGQHKVKGLFGSFVIDGLDKPVEYVKEFLIKKGLIK